MDKTYKAIMKALGGKPNGTGQTSCVEDAAHVKQILLLLGIAFSAGALSFSHKELPARVRVVEDKVLRIEAVSISIDQRLARIEQALIRK